MLEDESGRLRLIGSPLASEMLVTGCIVAVMGTENANGDFEVIDVKVPDLPPQSARWDAATHGVGSKGRAEETTKRDDEDEQMTDSPGTSSKKIAIVSGLNFSGTSCEHSLQLNLLLEYLLGEALCPSLQASATQISRLIIAGNSIASEHESTAPVAGVATGKTQKVYGYDSSAYHPEPISHLDAFLAELLPSLPVTLIPGAQDPANASLPQQPIHSAMFPLARAYGPASASEKE